MCANYGDAINNFLAQRVWAPPKTWSFNFGNVSAGADSYTDVIDLGENRPYTLLIAKKIGSIYSWGEFLEIQDSADGLEWAIVFGVYDYDFVARNEPAYGPRIYYVYGRPARRYVRVRHKNGSGDQNGLVIDLIVFSGV